MVLGGSPDSPKPGVVRTHALEQVTALDRDLPWSVLGPGAPVSLHGDNLDLALQSKLNSMNKQVTHLLRGRDPGEELLGDHRREGMNSFQDRYFTAGRKDAGAGGGGGVGGYPTTASAAQRRQAAGTSPRMQRLKQRVAEDNTPDLMERVYQDLESGRMTVDDALRMMEIHGSSWWGADDQEVKGPGRRTGGDRRVPGQSFQSPSGSDYGHYPAEAFDGCRRCGILQQQVKAISQSLVGLGARILHWLPTAGLTEAQQTALKTMVLDYSQPCAHVDSGVALLVKELLNSDYGDAYGKLPTQGGFESTLYPQADKSRTLPSFGFEMASSPSSPSGSPAKSFDFSDLNLGMPGLDRPALELAAERQPQPQQQQQQQQQRQHQQHQQQLSPQKRPSREQMALAEDFLQRYGFQHANDQKKTKRGSITSGFTTPLHVAVERCEADAVGALVACGANVTEVDSRGLTPLVLAHKINSNGSHAAVIASLQDGLEAVVDGRR